MIHEGINFEFMNSLEISLLCKTLSVYKDDGLDVVHKLGLHIDVRYL